MMTIRENVIKWLESLKGETMSTAYDCATNEQNDCLYTTTDGGMARLNVQKQENVNLQTEVITNSVKPHEFWHGGTFVYCQCPACLSPLRTVDTYCPRCKRKVEWDD